MVDNVTVGGVCAQSPSFMPDLDGGKNKAQLIIDDIVAYLKNPSVYSLEKEGPLNHFVNNCSEIEPWVLIGGGLIIIVSTSEQDPEGLIVTVGDIEGKYATQIPVPPALTTSLKDIFIRPHTNAKYECFTKEQIKANIKSNVINYNCKLHFNEKPENEIVCRHLSLQYCIDSMNEHTGKVPLRLTIHLRKIYKNIFHSSLSSNLTIYKKIHHPVHALLPVISLGRHYQSFFTEWKKRS